MKKGNAGVGPLSMFNAFELLDLPLSFHVNLEQLEEHYEKSQKRVHPDKWGGGAFPALLTQASQGVSARLTQAYQTLKDPVRRGEHLLILQGYWPLPSFPDLMEKILMQQEIDDIRDEKTRKSEYAQAYKAMELAFEQGGREDIQRAYWWFLHLSKSHSKYSY